ncbi:MAG: filamentous hemagglutinin N-terminal domain-containing protein [Stenotrophobium sp.]
MSKKLTLRAIPAALLAHRLSLALAAFLAPAFAIAGPAGATIVAGQIGITNPNINTTVINETSQNAIINWQQFNIANGQSVIFNQPSASAAVLNRVTGGSPSAIFGSLSSNGQVFLINPQGIAFGPGAQVNVGALVASTAGISDNDFLAGHYVFTGGTTAPVTNAGNIAAAKNGYVVLAGDYVNNTGIIQARLGTVALASGSAMTLDMNGDGLVNLAVNQAALGSQAGVSNLGALAAEGGTVIMTAQVANTLAGTVVNNSGVIHAQGIAENGGNIFLTASGGDATNAGTLDVSGLNGDNAGVIRINSDHDITLASGSSILAGGAGGGDVRIVANNNLSVEQGAYTDVGRLSPTGTAGYAEFSGLNSVTIRDIVHLGDNGTLLVDPSNFTIGATTGESTPGYDQTTLQNQLQSMAPTATVKIDASGGSGTDPGNITVLDDLASNRLEGRNGSNGGSLELIAGPNGSIIFNDSHTEFFLIGDITIHGGTHGGTQTLGSLSSAGNIIIDGFGTIAMPGTIVANSLSVTSTNGNIDLNGSAIVVSTGLASFGQDPALISALPASLKPTSSGPNAAFSAANGIVDYQGSDLTIGGGYIYMLATNILNFPNHIRSGGPLFWVWVPPDSSGSVQFNPSYFQILTNTFNTDNRIESHPPPELTFVFGSSTSTLSLDSGGTPSNPLDVHGTNTNFIYATNSPGTITNANTSTILTNGQVLSLINLSPSTSPTVTNPNPNPSTSGQLTPQQEGFNAANSVNNEVTNPGTVALGPPISNSSFVEQQSSGPQSLSCQ